MTHQNVSHRDKRFGYRRLLGTVAIAAVLSAVPSIQQPAAAQSLCGKRAELASALAEKFKESPVAAGLSQLGEVIEVFSSADGTTWTLVVTKPNGESCLVATGEAWLSLIRKAAGSEV